MYAKCFSTLRCCGWAYGCILIAALPPPLRRRQAVAAKLSPPSCRRQAAAAKLLLPPRHRQAAATIALCAATALQPPPSCLRLA